MAYPNLKPHPRRRAIRDQAPQLYTFPLLLPQPPPPPAHMCPAPCTSTRRRARAEGNALLCAWLLGRSHAPPHQTRGGAVCANFPVMP